MTQLRVGVIGVGAMGMSHARTLLESIPGASVSTVYDADLARATRFASEIGGHVSTDAAALIGSDDVDAVIVAAPDELHEELALACIVAGKPTLCEKPLAITPGGSRRVVDAELARGRRLVTVGFMRRFDPAFAQLRQTLAAGTLGKPRVVHNVHRNAQAHPLATSDGVVSNSMIHELDQVAWLLGEPLSAITVMAPPAVSAGGFRDTQIALLETHSGVVSTVEVSVNAQYGYDVQCEVLSERGTARLSAPYGLRVRRDGVDGDLVSSSFLDRFAEAYRLELLAWTGSVRTGSSVGASAWDGHVATQAAAAGVASLNGAGRVEIVSEPIPDLYR